MGAAVKGYKMVYDEFAKKNVNKSIDTKILLSEKTESETFETMSMKTKLLFFRNDREVIPVVLFYPLTL